MKIEPKIRIKGFEGEWKKYSFNNLFSLVSDYKSNIGNKTDYQEEGKYPIIDQSKEYIVGYTNEDNPIIPDNGIIVFGDHTREIKYIDFPFYTGADGTKLLHCQESVFPLFGYYSCCSQRIPNTGYNRHYKFLKEADYIIPSLTEQRAIATYFRHIDSLIETADKKVASLKQVKEASLQSMFPKGGQKVPEVRFKGFEGEWKECTFNNLVDRISSYSSSKSLPTVEFEDIISGENRLNKDVYSKPIHKGGIAFEKNDILFGKLRPYLKNILFATFNGIAVGDFWVLRANESYPAFVYTLVNNKIFMDVANISSGSKMPRADWNLVSKHKFLVPSFFEQRKIASFFVHIDKQIAIAQQRLDLLRRIKSACLDEMFV